MYYLYLSDNDKKEKGEIDDEPGAIEVHQHVPGQNDVETQDLPRDGKPAVTDFVDVENDSASVKVRGIDTDECDKKKEEKVDETRAQHVPGQNDNENQQSSNIHRHNSHHRASRDAHRHNSNHRVSREVHHDKLGSRSNAGNSSLAGSRPNEELVIVNQEQQGVRINPILCEMVHSTTRHRDTSRYENHPLPGAVAVSGPGDISTTGSTYIGYGLNDNIDSERNGDAIIPEAYLVTDDDESQARKRRRCFLGFVGLTFIVVPVIVALVLNSNKEINSTDHWGHWAELTESVFGELEYAHSGKSTAMSADGTVLAIGEPGVDTVRVFERDESSLSWALRGNPLLGPTGSNFGYAVAMSDDGRTVAAGGPNWGPFEGTGIVKMYRWTLPQRVWRLNHNVTGAVDSKYGIYLGTDVTLSSSGRTLAILAPYSAPRIEIWTSSTGDLDSTDPSENVSQLSEYDGEIAPHTIALRGDGLMIAVQSEGALSHVKLLTIDWRLQGRPIIGNMTVMSKNGDVMAVAVATSLRDGSELTDEFVDDDFLVDGHFFETTVYKWNESSSDWKKWGDPLEGFPVSLSFYGSIVAVAVPSLIRIYQNIVGSWTELGDGIPVHTTPSKVTVAPLIADGFHGVALAVSEWAWEGTAGSEQGRTTLYGLVESPDTTMPPGDPPTYAPTDLPSTSAPTPGGPPPTPPVAGDPPPTQPGTYAPTDLPPTNPPTDSSTEPPTEPAPTPVPAPPCETGRMLFRLEVTTDLYPQDLTWMLQKLGDETNILEGGPYADAFTKFSYEGCIPSKECYEFRFSDQNQDGPCCLNGEGGFTVLLDGEVIATYQYSESVNGVSSKWFGEC